MVRAIRHWSEYLAQREFILYSDHEALKYIKGFSKLTRKHASWVNFLKQFNYTIKHKAGVHNKVADALASLLYMVCVEVTGFDSFKDWYKEDPCLGPILKQTVAGQRTGFDVPEGDLFRGNQLCIPEGSLREKIVKELIQEGHFGRDKTLALISSTYWWPKLMRDVVRYMERCYVWEDHPSLVYTLNFSLLSLLGHM